MSRIYIWGSVDWSNSADTKKDDARQILDFPTYIPTTTPLPEFTHVSCGAKFTLLVGRDGKAYGFGNNSMGQLGMDTANFEVVEAPTALPIPAQDPIVEVAAGNEFSLALTSSGMVYSTGYNGRKQLGNCRDFSRARWAPVSMPGHVVHISAGYESSYAVTKNGDVYSWGSSRLGCLGHGVEMNEIEDEKNVTNYDKPQIVQYFVDNGVHITDLSAGKYHFLAISSKGEVFATGDGSYGKIGIGTTETAWEPEKSVFPHRKNPEKPVLCAAGGEVSIVGRECVMLGSMVYSWGRVSADFTGRLTPEMVEALCSKEVVGIRASARTMFLAWTKDGDLYVWGKNNKCGPNGLMGDVKHRFVEPHQVTALDGHHVVAAGCGSHHIVAVVKESEMSPELRIPLAGRYAPNSFATGPRLRYELLANEFRVRVLGEAKGHAYNDTLPELEEEDVVDTTYRPQGAHTLQTGSKVKVYMQDVEALGTIVRPLPMDELNPKARRFRVRWLREDWYDEDVELCSDDETDDVSNLDRWRVGWVHAMDRK
eukprot:PhM_4_TR2154/c0_g1_i1/m.9240